MKKITIAQARKQALNDCWTYHKDLLKEYKATKKELWDSISDCELNDWEDVGFFIGYIRALDDIASGEIKLK